MANPTTNYGWPMPTSADLVTDLPADFALFGQPVDTSLKALNPETTLGDIAYRSATSNTNTRLGIGTNGQVLAVSGGVPAWTTTADVTPLTTKGDLFTFTTVDARIGVGANNTVLTADSAEATGLKWAAPAAATPAFSLLATQAVTTGSSYSITGLSGYNTLFVLMAGLSSTAGGVNYSMTLNSDTASNYILGAAGIDSGAAASYGGADTKIPIATQGSAAGNTASASVQISGANGATNKIGVQGGGSNGTSSIVRFGGFSYSGTSVISSVQVITSGTFDAGTIYVYGSVA